MTIMLPEFGRRASGFLKAKAVGGAMAH